MIRPFYLSIRLRVCNERIVDPSALGRIEHLELIRIKVGAIICDNAMRNSISEYQLPDEADGGAGIQILDWFSLNPLVNLSTATSTWV